jgi:TPP-dependent pyruvate/acetoin dehydrogenase alpha subunit
MNELALYRTVCMIRKAERAIQDYYSEDEMKTPMHMSMGGEAIAAGVCSALTDKDQVFGTYRSHALYLAKTHDLKGFFGEMYGKISGNARGKAGSMHLSYPGKGHMGSSAIVGTSIAPAVGAAFAHKFKGFPHVAVAFFGDGAVDEGAFWESLNLACSMKVPVLFVCENNRYAVHTHDSVRQGYKKLSDVASGFECFFEYASSTNPMRIFDLTNCMVDKIRTEHRPGMLHLEYYRYLEHVGVNEDFDTGYREKAEAEKWYIRDPVNTMREEVVRRRGTFAATNIEKEVDELVAEAIVAAKADQFPGESEVCEGTFI